MRHRSRRPLLDILRWRPPIAAVVSRCRSVRLTPVRLVVASAVTLALGAGLVATAAEVGESSGELTAGSPGEMRTGFAVSRGGPRTSVPHPSPERSTRPAPAENSPTAEPHGVSAPDTPPATDGAEPDVVPEPDAAPEPSRSERSDRFGSPAAGPDAPTPSSAVPSEPSPSPSSTTPVDDTPPETKASTTSQDDDAWTVAIGANEPSRFACSLDDAAFEPCASSTEYDDLDSGRHTLAVRATDRAGNVDESPAVLRRHPTGRDDDD